MILNLCASSTSRKLFGAVFPFLLAIMLSGCATPKTCTYPSETPIFFPPAPDEPHIQYLTGINSSDDIGPEKKTSGLSLFLTGNEKSEIIKKIGKAYGISAYKGKLYVAEGMNGRVSIIDPVKGTIESPKGSEIPRGALKYPVNLTLDDEGNLYVADTSRKEIVVYDPSGNFLNSFAENFDPKSKIVDVKISNGKLFALDIGTSRIRVLDRKTGIQTAEIGYIEKEGQSVRLPGNFAFDKAGNIYVTNLGSINVTKYDQDGNFLGSFGGVGDLIGNFAKPKGIAVGADGLIYVVDGGTNVVQVFNDQFRPLTFFGWPGLPKGSLNGPAGIALSSENLDLFQKYAAPGFKLEGLIYVVSQFGQEYCIPRISVYGIGQMQKK